jgi:6-phosphogluconolactonase
MSGATRSRPTKGVKQRVGRISNMAFEIHTYPSDTALAGDAAARWLKQLEARSKSLEISVPYSVALSGGRVARIFFSEIARQAAGREELFKNVHFFWADERCVPPTDPENNYAIARQFLFEPLQIPAAQIHRLRGEENEALALRDALENIKAVVKPETKDGRVIFDMIFLGMGENGHVASLFPEEPEYMIADAAIYRAVTTVKPPPRRLTLGYSTIIRALNVWVLVAGTDKEKALMDSLSPAGKTPLAHVIKQRSETIILTDVKSPTPK